MNKSGRDCARRAFAAFSAKPRSPERGSGQEFFRRNFLKRHGSTSLSLEPTTVLFSVLFEKRLEKKSRPNAAKSEQGKRAHERLRGQFLGFFEIKKASRSD